LYFQDEKDVLILALLYAIAALLYGQIYVLSRWYRGEHISKQLSQSSEYIYLIIGFIGLIAIADAISFEQGTEANGDEAFAVERLQMATRLIDRDITFCRSRGDF